jgi:hypothetical protein
MENNSPKLYKLDWETVEISVNKGRFTHILRRPRLEELLARDRALQTEITFAKDGSFDLPDDNRETEANAALYDAIGGKTTGYGNSIPNIFHKSAAIKALYDHNIELDDFSEVFDEAVCIKQEIGGDDEPEFVIKHFLRQPSESELREYKKATANNRLIPGKRGKQTFIGKSNLRSAVAFYDKLFTDLEGAEKSEDCLAHIDALVKARVVTVFVYELTGALSD